MFACRIRSNFSQVHRLNPVSPPKLSKYSQIFMYMWKHIAIFTCYISMVFQKQMLTIILFHTITDFCNIKSTEITKNSDYMQNHIIIFSYAQKLYRLIDGVKNTKRFFFKSPLKKDIHVF